MSGREFAAIWAIALFGTAIVAGLVYGGQALFGEPIGGLAGMVVALAGIITLTWFARSP